MSSGTSAPGRVTTICTRTGTKLGRKQGCPGFQIKDLRRHYGIVLSESGAEMYVIQAVLGHSSVATTKKYYAHFSPAFAVRRALAVLEGRGRKTSEIAECGMRI